MATTVSAFTSLHSICRSNPHVTSSSSSSSSSLSIPIRNLCLRRHGVVEGMKNLVVVKKSRGLRMKIRAVEEETLAPEEAVVEEAPSAEQPVSVPVSPSDILTMFFQAEGTMNDRAIPSVTKALEGIEGITNLKVQVLEGIASVELAKKTTVQATGVASSLVETIQGSGFKLQTLNLSFADEEDLAGDCDLGSACNCWQFHI